MLSRVGKRQAGGLIIQLAAVVVLLVVSVAVPSSGNLSGGNGDNNSKPWILDGQPITAKEFPFLVSIWEELKDGPRHRCTGSLVGNNHIVTSARCIEDTANELTVKLGCTHLTRCKQELDIARVLVHPYYYLSRLKGRDQFDLAVLVTLESIEFSQEDGIMPIPMNTNQMDPRCKRQFMLVGIGRNASSGKDTMLKFRASVVHPNECAGDRKVGKRTICVHSTTGNLPQQYLGSALVAHPFGDGKHCEKQEAQLIGIVSSVRHSLLSTVTDLNATKEDLMNMIEGKPIKPDLPPGMEPNEEGQQSDRRQRHPSRPGHFNIDGILGWGANIFGRPSNPRPPINFKWFRNAIAEKADSEMNDSEGPSPSDRRQRHPSRPGHFNIDGILGWGANIFGRPSNPRPPINSNWFRNAIAEKADSEMNDSEGPSPSDRRQWYPSRPGHIDIDRLINWGHKWFRSLETFGSPDG